MDTLVILYRTILISLLFALFLDILVNNYVYIISIVIVKITYSYAEIKYKNFLPVKKKAVLITGCDTGMYNSILPLFYSVNVYAT